MIQVSHLYHSFKVGKKGSEKEIPVLQDVNLHIHQGEIATIVGKSGSGKSTLLHLISGYISPTAGEIVINNTNVTNFNEKEWAKFRLDYLGFIFQNFQLIPSLTTYENVELPLTLKGIAEKERKLQVSRLLERVGLQDHTNHYPNELSGGQQQRVSIARALITNPKVILADEPTGSLDSETEQEVLALIQELNREKGITFLMITHDEEVAQSSDRKLFLHDGVLLERGILHEV
ncbi:ABC transporter ATP-binding protein [Bacillus sp. FJAT-47783]|uniref:ABC transporter ATP-binding protein n=1 Tax=Bacillus sp. FJAT-47783 TaxID=2922712 RepID=UPI001FAE68F9|nr:ABC transporter ATP-binding protein [Bacillus sp. FJAT-47783]